MERAPTRSEPPGGRRNERAGSSRQDEISVLRFLNVLLRHRRAMVLAPVAIAFLVVAITLVMPRTYTSAATFTPQSGDGQVSQLAGIASQFGINIPRGEAAASPEFYADLLRTRELLRAAVTAEYSAPPASRGSGDERSAADLVSIFEIEADSRELAVARAIEGMRNRLAVSTDPETGVVELSVTTRWPGLSRQVAGRLLDLVNRFNLDSRQSQAAAERQFIEGRVAEAESALQAAEDSLRRFLERHRSFQNSPTLRFQEDRLQRNVDLRQQVYTSLAQAHEQAKIDEVRNTPVITVVDPPESPPRPDPRRLVVKGMIGLVLGGLVGVFWAFGWEMVVAGRESDPDDYQEFDRLTAEAKEDLRRLWGRLRRSAG